MSFFKAPAWAKPPALQRGDDEKDLFSHSDKFLEIQRDTIEQKKKRAERLKQKEQEREQRQKEKSERRERKNAIKRESTGEDGKDGLKKRRINSEESAKLLALAGAKPIMIDSDDDEATSESVSLPVRRSPRHQRTKDMFPSPRKTKSSLSSSIGAGDPDGVMQLTAVKAKPARQPEPEEEEDSDPEIAAIKRAAKEKHRQQLQQERSSTPNGMSLEAGAEAGPSHTPPLADPTISLLVTSDIPGTEPLLVKRKLSQNLKQVKEAWCQKQGYGKEMADKIFFAWNGRRLYGVTTCQRLGIEVDSRGNVVRADDRAADGAARVHIEAMTEELFAQSKAERARGAKADSGQYEDEEEHQDDEPEAEPAAKQQIRLTIKAKDRDDVRVSVTPTTMVSKILNYAKKQLKIPDEQSAYLHFDGERLDPDEPVSSTELEDKDGVDLLLGE
ncbi:DNA repair protein rad60 [Pseudocercospora fuligena]|uniref:DNA repair protein rad60 n=1 Tax=Pseudocercospora fuligena TaxID=685502 RepID=A0A8H6R8S4_9PEZI|nr:DNA repair protein rad60 [Pseudocercospora fuligena]